MTDKHELGDQPLEADAKELMHALAQTIDMFLNEGESPKKWGFVIMMFHFGDTGRCNYISNARRPDVMQLLKEQIIHFEQDDKAHDDDPVD